MTATTSAPAGASAPAPLIFNPRLMAQMASIARRSMIRTLRQPATVFPSIFFPLIMLGITSSGLKAAASIPHFPTTSYLAFIIVVPFMQSALFATTNAGSTLANDIEQGFLSRLALTPMSGTALILGQLAGAVSIAMMAAVVYLAIGLIAGVHIAAGIGGAILLVLLSTCISLAFASIGALLALRTGSNEAVQGMFPLLFVTFFLSSINLPRNLIPVDWFRIVATINPVSYMVEGMRSLVITGWDGAALAKGFAVALTITALALWGSASALRTRLVRT
ncbi:MAG: ABC transporter permease [Thermoleophilia bacterium]|nr:ABC transporter permease [Thermoleophilia bacterium]